MEALRTVVALALLLAAFSAAMLTVRAARNHPVALAGPLALALLVCVEAAVVRFLSLFHAVSAWPVAAAQVVIAAVGAWVAWRVPGARLRRLPRRPPVIILVPLAAVFAMVLLAGLAYRPDNWDSMTYHLARVAHWVQNRSVAPYPTNIIRQTVLPPGAEYLLLVLQVVSGSNRLAATVQLGSWVLLVGSVATLARRFGASRPLAGTGAVVVGAAPMAVLQASSTQNDLVAAALAAALVIASLPFLHRDRRWRRADILLMLAAVAGSVLVKPTSLLFAAPLVAAAALAFGATLIRDRRHALRDLAPLLVPALLVAVLLAKAVRDGRSETTAQYVYQGLTEPVDRILNSARSLLRNLPVSERLGDLLAPAETPGCGRPGTLCLEWNRQPNEDIAGNPALAVLTLAAVAAAALRWRALRPRSRLGVGAVVLGWLLFNATFRDNVWVTRLQLPSAAMAALALGALRARWLDRPAGKVVLGILAVAALAHGAYTAVNNAQRPLAPTILRTARDEMSYYRWGPAGVGLIQSQVLAQISRSTCRRLGLFIGGDTYDYPLTWRAMRLGFRVRHVVGPDDWPCAVYSDRGPPPARPDGREWQPTGVQDLFVAGEGAARGAR